MRKKIILSFILTMFVHCGFAQYIEVKKCCLAEMDLTAMQQGTQVLDQNGDKCALIKIQTTQTGFTYDVGSLGIQKTVQKTGEIWVYVPRGARKITIQHQKFGTLRDYSFPINIEAARTYILELETKLPEQSVDSQKKNVTSQYVLFRLTPSNAIVELDGQTLETSDGTATKRMPFGTYKYKIQAPKYAYKEGSITIDNPNAKHIVDISLHPQFVNMTFRVENNAEIWIDEVKQGKGECTVPLDFGTHEIVCKLPGHRNSSKEIAINGSHKNSTLQLDAPSPICGSLDINSKPADATVFIDGKEIGTTPLQKECLIGNHSVTIKKSGYVDFEKKLSVEEGKIINETYTLIPGDNEPIYDSVEENPSFPGGDAALRTWLQKNLRYPANALANGIQGRVLVSFIVNKDGSIVEPKIIRSVDPSLDKEAARIISSMPRWKPGRQRGKPVRVNYSLPITFRFQ